MTGIAEVLNNPGFLVTYAVIQAALILLAIRLLDPYEREPLSLLTLMALWGATGAAAIALVGNEALKSGLSPDAKLVFGDAISAPIVEEGAKGLALVAALFASRWASRRLGTPRFEGLTDGIVYGAAVGLGFAFTEDFFYFLQRAREQGLDAAADIFLTRRDFFGPAALHHPLFTAALGAGLGLGVWSRRRRWQLGFPLIGLGVALLMHAVNNGLVELVLLARYGLHVTAAWVQNATVAPQVDSTADAISLALAVVDYVYLFAFLGAIIVWRRYQGRLIAAELEEEVASGLIAASDRLAVSRPASRSALYWRLLRERRFEHVHHLKRLHRELVNLALAKWRIERFGGDRSRIRQLRRTIVSLQTLGAHAGNLPEDVTSLVGREREIEALVEALDRSDRRLITLTGPGGTGKTRLALRAAAELSDKVPGGVFFVALAPISERDRVPSAIAEALDVNEVAGKPILDRLEEYLFDKRLLLVLDNFEQVQAAAPDVSRLLAGAPGLRLLATSRSPLRVSGEREWPVPPLLLPSGDATDLESLRSSESVSLFLERANAVQADLTLTEANAPAIVEICRRLDGLPLAIELAASRVKVLPPEAMLDRLRDRLTLSSGGRADAPARQQTLRGAIEWSEDLLPATTRWLFRRLATFPAGCTLGAVEALAAHPSVDRGNLLGELGVLVDSSLVQREQDDDGQPRFAMLETIREFALERLRDHDEAEDAGEAQALYCLALAESAEPSIEGADQGDWAQRLEREYENLRAALLWLEERERFEEGLRLIVALARFWERRHLTDVRRWLESALPHAGGLPPKLRARAAHLTARLTLLQGDYPEARSLLDEATQRFRELGDQRGVLDSLWELGWIELFTGHYAEAEDRFAESLELARGYGAATRTSRALGGLGRTLAEQGRFSEATDLLEESLEIHRELRDDRGVAGALSALGRLSLLQGDHRGAETLIDEALDLAERLGDRLREAEVLYSATLLALERHEISRSIDLTQDRLSLCRDLGDKLGLAECGECLAAAVAARGEGERAARLAGSAEALRSSIGATSWRLEDARLERFLDPVRAESESTFDAAREEGRRMDSEAAAAYARSEAASLTASVGKGPSA